MGFSLSAQRAPPRGRSRALPGRAACQGARPAAARIDPVEERQAALRRHLTFGQAVEHYDAEKAVEFNSELHRRQWHASLGRHAVPVIGDMAVSDITLQDVLLVLRLHWTAKTETA